ncbi:hypothetical protein PR048_017632 [Dryococelus australis]|uniref:Uncharacterized protein n=1 Tax=Dryococelus australis TaxID=614101 RepID=A0ABQ9HA60_9NEOP|nr:hypothetical protein PR048_017632 [Dryococelus australis]
MKGRGKREIPEKSRRPTALSGTIPTCENTVTRPGNEPGSPCWEASVLISQPPWPLRSGYVVVRLLASDQSEPGSIPGRVAPRFSRVGIVPDNAAGRRFLTGISRFPRAQESPHAYGLLASFSGRVTHSFSPNDRRDHHKDSVGWFARPQTKDEVDCLFAFCACIFFVTVGSAVGERLDCSPPTKANRVQSPAGLLPDFRKWKLCRTMPLVGGFSWGSSVYPPFHSGAAPFSPRFTLIGSQDFVVKSGMDCHIFCEIVVCANTRISITGTAESVGYRHGIIKNGANGQQHVGNMFANQRVVTYLLVGTPCSQGVFSI